MHNIIHIIYLYIQVYVYTAYYTLCMEPGITGRSSNEVHMFHVHILAGCWEPRVLLLLRAPLLLGLLRSRLLSCDGAEDLGICSWKIYNIFHV